MNVEARVAMSRLICDMNMHENFCREIGVQDTSTIKRRITADECHANVQSETVSEVKGLHIGELPENRKISDYIDVKKY